MRAVALALIELVFFFSSVPSFLHAYYEEFEISFSISGSFSGVFPTKTMALSLRVSEDVKRISSAPLTLSSQG